MARAVAACACWLVVRASVTIQGVPLGGGGYISRLLAAGPRVYAGTDVGGAYLRNASAWVPLLDGVPRDESDDFSVAALAADPSDPSGDSLMLLLGPYFRGSPCTLVATTDAGTTWVTLVQPSNWTLPCGGNEANRGAGSRMAIHPANSQIALIGGIDGAVHVTTTRFQQLPLANISLAPSSGEEVRTVAWARLAGTPTGWVALASVPTLGLLFASCGPAFDSASTWQPVAVAQGSAAVGALNRIAIDANGTAAGGENGVLWVSHDSGVARGQLAFATSAMNAGSLTVTWVAASVPAIPFNAIAVHPAAPDRHVVAVSFGTANATILVETTDGGATWAVLNWSASSPVAWWSDNTYDLELHAASSLVFTGDTAVLGDFFGTWVSTGWNTPTPSRNVAWEASVQGIEETVLNFAYAPATGPVLAGAADVSGWVLPPASSDSYPNSTFMTQDGFHNCAFSADGTLDGTSVWMTAGDEYGSCRTGWCGEHHFVGVSQDGGFTFRTTTWDAVYASSNAVPYRVAVHPWNGSKAVVVGTLGMPLTFTTDGGATWQNATGDGIASVGVPGNFWWAQPIAVEYNRSPSSPALEATMYYYNGTTGFYVSNTSGASWQCVYNSFPPWNVPLFAVATPPANTSTAGDVWVFAGWQLWHSTDGGLSWSQRWEMYSVQAAIALGPLPAAAKPTSDCGYAVYAIGIQAYGQPSGVFASADCGATWQRLATPTQQLGDSPVALEASLQEPGVLYVGTSGRGLFRVTWNP